MSFTSFRKTVWDFYKKQGRHDLPWRKTHDPYKILVSEIMLQQTQVERVKPFYERFIKTFPTSRRLAAAPLSEVLTAWQGLGYNRRAKMLHAAAQAIGHGVFPKHIEELEKLPGIGPYTACAIATFAYNQDSVFIETNIRTVIIHTFFSSRRKVSDTEIAAILVKVLPQGKSREWYYALMDYGSFLKRSGVRTNAKSKHYVKQSKFSGSLREARGAILRELSKKTTNQKRIEGLLGDDRVSQVREAQQALLKEGLIEKRGKDFSLPRFS